MSGDVSKLAADDRVTARKGIFEYLLGGSLDTKLLEVRVFETYVKRAAYQAQTKKVEGKGKSNCPLCAVGHGANKSRIYKFEEMDADHVTAWSKGGESRPRTARCSALLTTGPRVTDSRACQERARRANNGCSDSPLCGRR